MKRYTNILVLTCLLLPACHHGTNKQQRATAHLNNAYHFAATGQFSKARTETDSIHILYPEQVSIRRQAKRLCDSIGYVEGQRTIAYTDSVLKVLLPEAEKLLKIFKYEKNTAYERNGKYVHRLLSTNSNTARCYLQCYVSDQRVTTVKSYYFGPTAIEQNAIELSANGMEIRCTGKNHTFESEGRHEIMTLDENESLQLLNFVSAHRQERIRVRLNGTRPYVYYLQDNEKAALEDTYRLSLLMQDIRKLEEQMQLAEQQINKWEEQNNQKHAVKHIK